MIKRIFFAILFLFGLLVLGACQPANVETPATGNAPVALLLTANGALTPAMAEYLDRGLRIAVRDSDEVLILQLDTPGGSLDLMERMAQAILNSSVPVVVYVAPNGAMAGSAGTIITLAGHASAMAPATFIGAASPVSSQGQNLDSTEEAKLKNAMRAYVRSMTENRNPEAIQVAEQMVESAQAMSASEAKDIGLIDFIATDLPDLMHQLDGFTVTVNGSTRALHTANATIQPISQSIIEGLLGVLTNPNIVYLLLTIGVQAILIELSSPGGWVAGFIGAVCLVLAIYGLGFLTVNWVGIIFLVIAFILFILDIKAPTHGALTAAGVGSMIVGALVLFNSPATPSFQRVSVPLVVGTTLFTAAIFFTALTFGVRAQRIPVLTGTDRMVGREGIVRSSISPRGNVQLGGELWGAELVEGEEPLPPGTRVQVVEVKGLRLRVRKV